ncbi:unnamed protein product [Camellia sinensis]
MEGLDDLLAKHKGSKSNDNYEANGSTMLQPSLSVNLFISKSTKKFEDRKGQATCES